MWSLKHSRSEIQPSVAGLVSQWNRKGPALLTGSSGIFYLAHVWQFGLVCKGFHIHTVDCAIRFDAYAIAEEALRNGISPEDIHDRITVSRCFTPYQILDEMNYLLRQKNRHNQLNFIFAPSKQFFDGDVSLDEGLFLLKKLSGIFANFERERIPLMVVEKDSYSHPAFRSFFSDVQRISRPVFQLRIMEKKQERKIKKIYSVRVAGLISEAV